MAENFAKREYKSYILIDFSNTAAEAKELFDNIFNFDYFFLRLQIIYRVTLEERNSVIIFDEVQQAPLARQAIKHLVKDGRFDYIETGSLISIRKNIKDIVIPSEENQITLFPMDYEEFCWALGDVATISLIRACFEKQQALSDGVNRQLMRNFRLYMLVGGMPQAIEAYLNRNDMSYVDSVKRKIIELYEQDFMRIDPTGKVSRLFRSIPQQLASNSTRFIPSKALNGHARPSLLGETIADIADSMTVNVVYHANDPSVGMALHGSMSAYKLYMADTGLFVTLAFMDKR